MKQALLDTNFILTCVKQKIDFFEELKLAGIKILIPIQVLKEIENISKSKQKLHFKEDSKLAIKIIGMNNFEKVNLNGKNVDESILRFLKEKENVLIATLDKEIKNKAKNKKIVIRGKKQLLIEY